jgi:hypothetical protein
LTVSKELIYNLNHPSTTVGNTMKITIDAQDFIRAFQEYNRTDQFSKKGLGILFDYLEEVAPDYELDVIDLCCDYVEQSWQDIANDHHIDLSDCEDDAACIEAVRDHLEYHTSIVGEPETGVFLYAAY